MIAPRQTFLGIDFDPLSLDDATRWLAGRGADAPYGYVVTPNVDHVVKLDASEQGAEVRSAYRGATLRLCDSRILARLAGAMGINLPVVPGSDLTVCLFADVLRPADRICLIGGDADVLMQLRRGWPGLDILQHIPPMGMRSNPQAMAAAVAFAAAANARFILFAVAFPQQEMLAFRLSQQPGVTGTGLCVGASLDFLTGRKSRAPQWMRRASLEWLYRLLAEPRRLGRRYLIEGPRVFVLAWRWRGSGRR